MKLTQEEASKSKKKRAMEESSKTSMRKQCRAANGKECAGRESAVMASVCAIKDSILVTIASTRYAQTIWKR